MFSKLSEIWICLEKDSISVRAFSEVLQTHLVYGVGRFQGGLGRLDPGSG